MFDKHVESWQMQPLRGKQGLELYLRDQGGPYTMSNDHRISDHIYGNATRSVGQSSDT